MVRDARSSASVSRVQHDIDRDAERMLNIVVQVSPSAFFQQMRMGKGTLLSLLDAVEP